MKSNLNFDRLSRDILLVCVLLGAFAVLLFGSVVGAFLCMCSVLLIILVLWRISSKNTIRREKEMNAYDRFLRALQGSASRTAQKLRSILKRDSAYRQFCCPECKQKLRAPRNKGRIRITCSKCGARFEKRT